MLRRITIYALMLILPAVASISSKTKAAPAADDNNKNYTAEQVVETTIAIYGSRPALAQVRRNGWERGRITSVTEDGRTEDSTYERRFVRGESLDKDKVRLDQKTPTQEYSLVYTDGKTFGLIKESSFTPREDAASDFLSQMWHGIDALLRYKENGSAITLFGKDKQQNIDLYVIDLVDKEKRRTRYYISQKFFRVLWLEYEEAGANGNKPVKYARKFFDYQYIQGTLVPKRTLYFEDGKQKQEIRVQSVTYGIKMDDTLFKNPEAQTSAAKP
ncbi:MAG TPA: hypothetical protein VM095_15220 [Pyrinomonadaceae bacterium]|nr:hypothetical protein [Pyrinomonadaceae bacterium]